MEFDTEELILAYGIKTLKMNVGIIAIKASFRERGWLLTPSPFVLKNNLMRIINDTLWHSVCIWIHDPSMSGASFRQSFHRLDSF